VEAIGLKDFLDGVQGKPYKELVQYHLKQHDTHNLLKACTGTISLLPGKNQNLPLWENFLDHMNGFIPNKNLWMMNCMEAFRFIIAEYNAALYKEFKEGIYNYIESKDISFILAQAGWAINEIVLAGVFGKLISKLSPSDNEFFFNIFQIVTLNYAYNASAEPKIRKLIGIKKGFFR